MSSASTTQLYNPVTRNWSALLLQALHLPPKLFPSVISAGTKLGALRPEVAKETGLQEAQVVTSCSNELAAALMGLPVGHEKNWAFLKLGRVALVGTELPQPIINDLSREWNFTNEVGYGGSARVSKQAAGFWILDECRRHWQENDREVDIDLLMHLAISAEPFESLINPMDPRFLEPGDMPLKIQAFCRETNQTVPYKPGPITRCVLESLALHYRKTLDEVQYLTNRDIAQLYIFGESSNTLLNNFIANALQIPVTIAPPDVTAIGNVVVQGLALGHLKSVAHAREVVRHSFQAETIVPHAAVWNAAYNRLAELFFPEKGESPAQ